MPKQTLQQFGQSIKAKHPEYKDMDDAALGKAVLQKYPQYQDMVEQSLPASKDTISATPDISLGGALRHPLNTLESLGQEHHRPADASIGEMLGSDVGNVGAGALHVIRHPIDTVSGMLSQGLGVRPIVEHAENDILTQLGKKPVNNPAPIVPSNPDDASYAIGQSIPVIAAGEAAPAIARGVSKGGSAIRTAAIGDPNVAALKGLRVGAGSPKSLSTVRAVEGARPFLQGAKSLEDLQGKLPSAKSEIWGPYQGTVDAIGDKAATGPDGPTTVRALEEERQQLSALNRKLKQQNPEAIQLAQQKGMTQAQLMDREKAVQQALDPHLEEAGIDPKLIRKTFGQVAQVSDRVSGKSTLAEEKQPYGFSKLKDVSLTKPLSNIPLAADAARDVVAGRYLSAKPTDVAIRDAFRLGGPKPDFRAPISAMPTTRPPFRLPAETTQNADFGFPESRMLDSGIGHSQRTIASPEILPPDPHAVRLPRETPPQPVQAPDPQTLHTYPVGSAYRNLELGAPEYPVGSTFRPKAKPFNLDEYLKGTQ